MINRLKVLILGICILWFAAIDVNGLPLESVEATSNKTETKMNFICKECVKLLAPIETLWHNDQHELLYIVSQSVGSPLGLCNLLLKDKCGDPNGDWTVRLPGNKPPVRQFQQPPANSPKLRVLHLADIHIDPKYRVGSSVDCGEPLCCRAGNSAAGKSQNRTAGHWGTVAECDIPYSTVDYMFAQIAKQNKDKLDAIVWTGDLEPHDLWNYKKEDNIIALKNLTALFLKHFPKIPIFSAVGNHEAVPPNSFAPDDAPSEFGHDWLYNTLANQWMNWLPNSTMDSIKHRASYMVNAWPGLRIISLNTQYSYTDNFWLYMNQNDPDGTLSWLVEQLSYAEKAGDLVWIIGHIPSGNHDVRKYWSRNFNDVINRFESTIAAQFYGHTHADHFAIFYENHDPLKGRPTSMMYIAPSTTTFGGSSGVNPSYRIYDIDGPRKDSSWSVLDSETYATDLTKTNEHTPPTWPLEYKTKAAYGMKSLTPMDWHLLTKRMETDPKLVEQFRQYYHRRPATTCDANCQDRSICYMRRADSNIDCDPKTENPPNQNGFTPFTQQQIDQMKKICKV